jgi:ABC-type sugar transport system permease subunit
MTVSMSYHQATGIWSASVSGASAPTVLLFVVTIVIAIALFTVLVAKAERLLEKY